MEVTVSSRFSLNKFVVDENEVDIDVSLRVIEYLAVKLCQAKDTGRKRNLDKPLTKKDFVKQLSDEIRDSFGSDSRTRKLCLLAEILNFTKSNWQFVRNMTVNESVRRTDSKGHLNTYYTSPMKILGVGIPVWPTYTSWRGILAKMKQDEYKICPWHDRQATDVEGDTYTWTRENNPYDYGRRYLQLLFNCESVRSRSVLHCDNINLNDAKAVCGDCPYNLPKDAKNYVKSSHKLHCVVAGDGAVASNVNKAVKGMIGCITRFLGATHTPAMMSMQSLCVNFIANSGVFEMSFLP